ncbi:hypothetical protein GYMLUDRAFT_99971 [Collybiopsis luxurians FD-317 M1]|uniref:Uncharacterized protein n=1 Tax=Collybiopsis luxurians FD-317 M1 TaxID=944289 RepID=A0A0D0CI75_9AGAR|nr:hypothetical protein GYMLUDRAFT_99971 [Collybiopsis luxurians FD-317 M1]
MSVSGEQRSRRTYHHYGRCPAAHISNPLDSRPSGPLQYLTDTESETSESESEASRSSATVNVNSLNVTSRTVKSKSSKNSPSVALDGSPHQAPGRTAINNSTISAVGRDQNISEIHDRSTTRYFVQNNYGWSLINLNGVTVNIGDPKTAAIQISFILFGLPTRCTNDYVQDGRRRDLLNHCIVASMQ